MKRQMDLRKFSHFYTFTNPQKMVEVFKTNVENYADANMLLHEIHNIFTGHEANFDLDDCDKILRVKCKEEMAEPSLFIRLLHRFGFCAEVLPDVPCLRYEIIK